MTETHGKCAETHACDLISRQAAMDAIAQHLGRRNAGIILDHVPSAQQWIPTSERLPKVREWVLCQCRAGIMDVLRLTEGGDWNKNYPHAEYMSGFVIAWMPLPASYHPEGDEKHEG